MGGGRHRPANRSRKIDATGPVWFVGQVLNPSRDKTRPASGFGGGQGEPLRLLHARDTTLRDASLSSNEVRRAPWVAATSNLQPEQAAAGCGSDSTPRFRTAEETRVCRKDREQRVRRLKKREIKKITSTNLTAMTDYATLARDI